MGFALYAIGLLLLAVGFVGLLVPILPGAPLMFLGIVSIAWADDFARIGPGELGVAAVITGLIVLVDWLAALVGAKRFGASRWGVAGAVLGAAVGIFFGLPGIVLGPVAGAVALELLRKRDVESASRIGLGTLVGFVFGKAVEYALALVLLALTVWFYWNP